jgi:diguanylate cyclase (GGDEF)-like protein
MNITLTTETNASHSKASRRPQAWPAWITLIATLTLVLMLGVSLLSRSYARVTQEQRNRLETQALVVAENMDRQLHSIDNALRAVRSDLNTSPGNGQAPAVTPRQLKTLSEAMPSLKGIMATDAKGTVSMAERAALHGTNFSYREYFSAARDRTDYSLLYVSSPFVTRQGNYSINLTKAVPDAQGRFNGVVTANLDPSYFEILARSVLYAPDMRVSLVHGSGKIFIDARHAVELLGSDIGARGSLFSQHLASERDESVMQGKESADHTQRMVVYRTILPADLSMDTPLVVAVSREVNAIYAVWWKDLATYALLFVVLCAGSATWLRLSQQRKAAACRELREKKALNDSATAKLMAAAALQRRTGKLAKVGGWQLEMATMEMAWTQEMYEIYDLPHATSLSLEQALACYTEETRPALENAIRKAMAFGTPWSVEACMVTARGLKIWVRNQGEAVVHAGQVVRLTGASQDVTERVQYAAKLATANKKLELLAVTDSLTGVGNRRCFDQQLAAEWSRCQRRNIPLGLLMLDIDHFKLYNDRYGHPRGDETLSHVATILSECAQRSGELVARYGGEEFAVLLPGSDPANTRKMAQDIIAELTRASIPHGTSPTAKHVTVSVGAACTTPVASIDSLLLVQTADIALYAAKTRGRNRVEQAEFPLEDEG